MDGRLLARARRIGLRPRIPLGDHRWLVDTPWFDVLETRVVDVADEIRVALLRLDPPVDPRYLRTTYLLDVAADAGVHVVNRPSGVREMQEKLWVLRFPDLCPDTLVSADVDRVLEFVGRHGSAVLKPVDGFAGIDVWLLRADDRNARSMVESATARGSRHVIVQEYLPAVDTGNKRLFVLDGEIIGTVDRVPSRDDFRIGPPSVATEPDAHDRSPGGHARAVPAPARHRAGRPRRHRRTPHRGQRHLPRRHAQDRRPAGHRPERHDHAPFAPPLRTTPPRKGPHMNTLQIVCVALLGALLFVLGANVTRHRVIRGGTGNQMPTDPADRMFIAIRAHGNAAEYVPTLCVLILICGTISDGWWVDVLALAAVAVRLSHAVGMLTTKTMASHGPLRDFGALGTYATGLALAVTAVVVAAA